jgi:tetratricopeptide (TPR) repeat protein
MMLAIACVMGSTRSVRAENKEDFKATARELFLRGRAHLASGDYDKAANEFKESQQLDPGGGTLLNLALSHELEGKTATAWAEFAEAARLARRDGREDRETVAVEHVRALEPRLSRLRLEFAPGLQRSALTVKRDGVVVGEAAWSEPTAVDPGEHWIEVSSPGKASLSLRVVVCSESCLENVVIPPLSSAPVSRAQRSQPLGPRVSAAPRSRATRVWGVGAGVAGASALAVGGFFGVRAIVLQHQSKRGCAAGVRLCSAEAMAQNESATRSADWATGFVVGGLASVALSATLLLLPAPRGALKSARWQLGVEGRSVTLAATW